MIDSKGIRIFICVVMPPDYLAEKLDHLHVEVELLRTDGYSTVGFPQKLVQFIHNPYGGDHAVEEDVTVLLAEVRRIRSDRQTNTS